MHGYVVEGGTLLRGFIVCFGCVSWIESIGDWCSNFMVKWEYCCCIECQNFL